MFTFEFLAECFSLDEESGILRWKERPASHFLSEAAAAAWNAKFPGKTVGTIHTDGRLRVTVSYRHVYVHRAVYALSKRVGLDQFGIIDHANADFLDNRPLNLREATASQNCMNTLPATVITGAKKGVRKIYGKWRARIQAGGNRRHLGTFDTEEEAFAAYVKAAESLHGAFMRV